MKRNEKSDMLAGIGFLTAFLLWTILIRCVDVQAAGANGTGVGSLRARRCPFWTLPP